MKRNVIETVLGAVVLLVAGVFLAFAYTSADLRPVAGYKITARFNAVDGLTVGSDVRVGGVKIGSVIGQSIDLESYKAVVSMSIRPDIGLPEDSVASVSSEGLLGGKYVRIDPGASDKRLADGSDLSKTRDIVSLEEMLGKVIFLVTDELENGG
ncbi:MAG: outer membrane lipid asymmetry maintenance protein MlaD [Alphaproteobacteria bacterium]|nr:outer membrane lipid asymmetry maintenance protein MlaD [Alphaproteobacteria bacterium]